MPEDPTTTTTVAAPEPGTVEARRWWILGVLSCCVIVIGVDNTILNVALPSIVRGLGASGSQLQWMVDAYTLVFACLLLTAGSLGDRYGRQRALLFGLVWFGGCSALAATSSSPTMLIGARALQGIGGAFIFPTTLSILTNTFRDSRERARAIGVWAGTAGLGIALGPIAGGLLVENFGWPAVFLVNVPICITAAILVWRLIPNTKNPDESPLDPIGAGLSIVGLVGILLGIIEGPNMGWTSPLVLTGFIAGGAFLLTFAWWERHTDGPMIDVRFFKNPRFSAASATITLAYFSLFASTFVLTLYFQFILGYSPLKSGLMLTPVALGLMIGSPLAPRFVQRFGTTRVVVPALCVVAACVACYASDTLMSSFTIGFLIRGVYGIAMGFTTAPVTESIMGSLPPGRAGVGSAVNDTTRQTGGALGVAVLGSILAAKFHQQMGTAALPASVRHAARDSIGVALAVAKRLPANLAAQLHTVARHAFLAGTRLAFFVAMLFVLGAVVVAARFLPAREQPAPTPTPTDLDQEAIALEVERLPA